MAWEGAQSFQFQFRWDNYYRTVSQGQITHILLLNQLCWTFRGSASLICLPPLWARYQRIWYKGKYYFTWTLSMKDISNYWHLWALKWMFRTEENSDSRRLYCAERWTFLYESNYYCIYSFTFKNSPFLLSLLISAFIRSWPQCRNIHSPQTRLFVLLTSVVLFNHLSLVKFSDILFVTTYPLRSP